jgi:hypothetical protein
LRAPLVGVSQAGGQRLRIGVNVGQQGNAQRTCSGKPV